MRIITLNVNGLRSAASKGFGAWMRRQRADIPEIDALGRFLQADFGSLGVIPPC
jgi:hypothetical protein